MIFRLFWLLSSCPGLSFTFFSNLEYPAKKWIGLFCFVHAVPNLGFGFFPGIHCWDIPTIRILLIIHSIIYIIKKFVYYRMCKTLSLSSLHALKYSHMKTTTLLMILAALSTGGSVKAQFLKNLAKKAEKAAERSILNRAERETEEGMDNAMDSIWGSSDSESSQAEGKAGLYHDDTDYNTAKNIKTELKRSFYTHDVVIHTVNDKKEITESFFDAEELAMRATSSKSEHPLFTDSEGYQYGFNEHNERWEKTGIMRSDAMSFMMPAISMSMLKLPPEPMLDATTEFKDKGLNLNTFLMVEWVFIYKPEDFRFYEYTEKKEPCETGSSCVTFMHNDPEYLGSYVQFDNEGRLSRIYVKVNNDYTQEEGSFHFQYKPVSVRIPKAVEVKQPFQDILSKGLNVDE